MNRVVSDDEDTPQSMLTESLKYETVVIATNGVSRDCGVVVEPGEGSPVCYDSGPEENRGVTAASDMEASPRYSQSGLLKQNSVFAQMRRKLKSFRQTRRQDELYSSKLRPTNRLILLVVVMSFGMALTVAGTAVGLQWQSSTESRKEALRTELNLATRAVSSFVNTKRALSSQTTAAAIATSIVYEAGYHANLHTTIKTEQKCSKVMSLTLANLFKQNSLARISLVTALLTTATDHLCAKGHCELVPEMLNALNAVHRASTGISLVLTNYSANEGSTSLLVDGNGCVGQPLTCLSNATRAAAEMTTQLKTSGTSFGNTEVIGYAYAPRAGLGLVCTANATLQQANFLNLTVRALDEVNTQVDGTIEVMVQSTAKPGYPLTAYRFLSECVGGCKRDEAGARVVNGEDSAVDLDYRHTDLVIATGFPLQGILSGFYFIFEIDLSQVAAEIMIQLKDLSKSIDNDLPGSQKLLLGQRVLNKTSNTYSYLMLDPENHCNASSPNCFVDQPLQSAAAQCGQGSGLMKDFRNVDVVSAYHCVSEMGLVLAMEIDYNEIVSDSISDVVGFANTQNSRETSSSIELMIPQTSNLTTVNLLSNPKTAAITSTIRQWAQSFDPFQAALKGSNGITSATDYRGVDVLAAFDYSPELNIGFVLKLDVSDFQKPLLNQMGILLGAAIGIAIFGVLCVGFFSRRMLSHIEDTWEKGKKAVQDQKESFEHLVAAMYPKFATEKLLAGEVQIVLEVPEATVFFSDICNFTMISNRLTASGMIDWIGYVFGVMDHIAEFHKIYKVKTIGDAYFAISGPPSLIEGVETTGHTLRMLRFASDCAQIFSGNYSHPDAGSCLKIIAAHSAIMKREKRAAAAALRRPSLGTSSSIQSGASSIESSGSNSGANPNQCVMRYGIAAGPVTMGVLQGKRPLFDVWGKTVNLAARMENAGQPSMIQCSESVYGAVVAEGQTEFIFDEARIVFAKGFGNVPAYFIRESLSPPARALLDSLALEPAVGAYVFTSQQYRKVNGGGGVGGTQSTTSRQGKGGGSLYQQQVSAGSSSGAQLSAPPRVFVSTTIQSTIVANNNGAGGGTMSPVARSKVPPYLLESESAKDRVTNAEETTEVVDISIPPPLP